VVEPSTARTVVTIYDICDGELLVPVVKVGHRRDVYER
jgi:mRNA-degrading endonuclease RelE of RelBE toxin-antitoxin system